MYAVFDKDFFEKSELENKTNEELISTAKTSDDACLYKDDMYNCIVETNEDVFSNCHVFYVRR